MAVSLELKQAILLRLFTEVFGKNHVIYNISLWLLLEEFKNLGLKNDEAFKNLKCFLTILSKDDSPKMIVEFDPLYDKDKFIDIENMKKHEVLEKILAKLGISYIIITQKDFEDLTDKKDRVSLVDLLNFKLGLDED